MTVKVYSAGPDTPFGDRGPISGTLRGNTLTAHPSAQETYSFTGSVSGGEYAGASQYTATVFGT